MIYLFTSFAQFWLDWSLLLPHRLSDLFVIRGFNIHLQLLMSWSAFRYFLWYLWLYRFWFLCSQPANSFLWGFHAVLREDLAHSQIYEKVLSFIFSHYIRFLIRFSFTQLESTSVCDMRMDLIFSYRWSQLSHLVNNSLFPPLIGNAI